MADSQGKGPRGSSTDNEFEAMMKPRGTQASTATNVDRPIPESDDFSSMMGPRGSAPVRSSQPNPYGAKAAASAKVIPEDERADRKVPDVPRPWRLYGSQSPTRLADRKDVYYELPPVEVEDQHGYKRKMGGFKGVVRNYDVNTGEPLPVGEIEPIPEGARIVREESFTEERLSPYYHTAKKANQYNEAARTFNKNREATKELYEKFPFLTPSVRAEVRRTGDFSPALGVLGQGMTKLSLATDAPEVQVPPFPREGSDGTTDDSFGAAAKKVGKAALSLVRMGDPRTAPLETPRFMKDGDEFLDMYLDPQNPAEYWLSYGIDIAATLGTAKVATAIGKTVGNAALKAASKGFIDPAGLIKGGVQMHGLDLFTRGALAPIFDMVPMDTDDAKSFMREHFPKVYTGGMTDEEIREYANSMKRLLQNTGMNETIEQGGIAKKLKDLTKYGSLIDKTPYGWMANSRHGKLLQKGIADYLVGTVHGLGQEERDVRTVMDKAGKLFAYDGGDLDVEDMINGYVASEDRLKPQGLTEHVAYGIGQASVLMPFFASAIQSAGGKGVEMASGLKGAYHGIKMAMKKIPGAGRVIANELGGLAHDSAWVAARSFGLGLTTAVRHGEMKDTQKDYERMIDEGLTPAQAAVASWGMYLGKNAIENLSEAGYFEIMNLSKRYGDNVIKSVFKGAARRIIPEGSEERVVDYMGYMLEELADIPEEYREYKSKPAEWDVLSRGLVLDDEQKELLQKAAGDFLIAGGLGLGFGALKLHANAVVHPVQTTRQAVRGVRVIGGKVIPSLSPRNVAEEYASRYHFDRNFKTGEKRDPEQTEAMTQALADIIELNTATGSKWSDKDWARSIGRGLLDTEAIIAAMKQEKGFTDDRPWNPSEDQLRDMYSPENLDKRYPRASKRGGTSGAPEEKNGPQRPPDAATGPNTGPNEKPFGRTDEIDPEDATVDPKRRTEGPVDEPPKATDPAAGKPEAGKPENGEPKTTTRKVYWHNSGVNQGAIDVDLADVVEMDGRKYARMRGDLEKRVPLDELFEDEEATIPATEPPKEDIHIPYAPPPKDDDIDFQVDPNWQPDASKAEESRALPMIRELLTYENPYMAWDDEDEHAQELYGTMMGDFIPGDFNPENMPDDPSFSDPYPDEIPVTVDKMSVERMQKLHNKLMELGNDARKRLQEGDTIGARNFMNFLSNRFSRLEYEGNQYIANALFLKLWNHYIGIKYDPKDMLARGEGFFHEVNKFSHRGLNESLSQLWDALDNHEKTGRDDDAPVLSVLTNPFDYYANKMKNQMDTPLVISIYPSADDIQWAGNQDVYSGNYPDPKVPSTHRLSSLEPGLEYLSPKKGGKGYNELGVRLRKGNFRFLNLELFKEQISASQYRPHPQYENAVDAGVLEITSTGKYVAGPDAPYYYEGKMEEFEKEFGDVIGTYALPVGPNDEQIKELEDMIEAGVLDDEQLISAREDLRKLKSTNSNSLYDKLLEYNTAFNEAHPELAYQHTQDTQAARIADNPEAAAEITAALQRTFPEVRLESITGRTDPQGRPILGFADSRGLIAAVDFAKGNLDTPPHEYFHLYANAFQDSRLINEGVARYGSYESFVQAVGEHYARRQQQEDSWLTNWLADFWNFIKSIFGRDDIAQTVVRRFERGLTPYSFAERVRTGANRRATIKPSEGFRTDTRDQIPAGGGPVDFQAHAPDFQEEGTIDQAEEKEPRLKGSWSNVPRMYSTPVETDGGLVHRDVRGYPVSIEGFENHGLYLAHPPTHTDTPSSKFVLYDKTGRALTPALRSRQKAIDAFLDLVQNEGAENITRIMYEENKPQGEQLPQAKPTVPGTTGTGPVRAMRQSQRLKDIAYARLSNFPLAGSIEAGMDMQDHASRALGVPVEMSDAGVRELLALRREDGTAPIEEMTDILMDHLPPGLPPGTVRRSDVRAYVIKNHQRRDIPLISVTLRERNADGTYPKPMVDVAPPGTAMRNATGQPEQTYQKPPNVGVLAKIEQFMEDYGLAPHPMASYPMAILRNVRIGGRFVDLGKLAGTKPKQFQLIENRLASEGIYLLGPAGKNDTFAAIMVDPDTPLSQKAADALVNAMLQMAEKQKQKDEEAWNKSASRAEFVDRWQRIMKNGKADPGKMNWSDRKFAVFAAFMEHVSGPKWASMGNKFVKYLKEFMSADNPVAPDNVPSFIQTLTDGIDERIRNASRDERDLWRNVKDGLRLLTPQESELAAKLNADGFDLYAGGIAINRGTGEAFVTTVFVDHDHYVEGTPVGDGGNFSSALASLVQSVFQGGEERPKLHKPRVLKGYDEFAVLLKAMHDIMDGNMHDAATMLGVGLVAFDSTIKVGKETVRHVDPRTGHAAPLPTYSEFETLALSGKLGGTENAVPVRRIALTSFTNVSDPEGKRRDDTALGLQAFFANPVDSVHFPHLSGEVDTIRNFFQEAADRAVDAVESLFEDATFRGAIFRRLARADTNPTTEAIRDMVLKAGRNLQSILYLPHFMAAFEGNPVSEMLDPVTARGGGGARAIGQGLKLGVDSGTATMTNIKAVLRSNPGAKLEDFFDIEKVVPAEDAKRVLNPVEQKEISELRTKIIQQRARAIKSLSSASPEDTEAITKARNDQAEANRILRDMETAEQRMLDTFMLQYGYRRLGDQYFKGTGFLKDFTSDGDVPIVVDKHTADLMGWEVGRKVLVTAIPTDAVHSTKACIIVGLSEGARHRMSWSPEHTRKLGKDHDGDALYLRSHSKGYWQRKHDELYRRAAEQLRDRGEVDDRLADEMVEYETYARLGWMELDEPYFEAMYNFHKDPAVRDYTDGLYRKYKIPGAFSREAVEFLRKYFPPSANAVVTPLDEAGRLWFTSNYVGATQGAIGQVAALRRDIEYLIQASGGNVNTENLDEWNMITALLLNHAVDAPAQEHFFGYQFDTNAAHELAFRMLFPHLDPASWKQHLADYRQLHHALKDESDTRNNVSVDAVYQAFATFAMHNRNGSFASAFMQPFRRLMDFTMDYGYFRSFVAPEAIRSVIGQIFGEGTELYTPDMLESQQRPLSTLQQQTVFGMLKQAWEDAKEAGGMDAAILRGPASIIMTSVIAQQLSRSVPVTDSEGQYSESAQREINKRREDFSRFLRYSRSYRNSPLRQVLGFILGNVNAKAPNLTSPSARLFSPLDGVTKFHYHLDRWDGLMVSTPGSDPVKVTQQFIDSLFEYQPGQDVSTQRPENKVLQFYDALVQVANLTKTEENPTFFMVRPTEAGQLINDMLDDYMALTPSEGMALRAEKLTDALRVFFMLDNLVTLQPMTNWPDKLEIRVVEDVNQPGMRQTAHASNPTRLLAAAGRISEISHMQEFTHIQLGMFSRMTDAMREAWMKAVASSPAMDLWYKTRSELAARRPLATAKDPVVNDIVEVDGEEVKGRIRDVTSMIADALDVMKSPERLQAEGIEATAERLIRINDEYVKVAQVLHRLAGVITALDKKVMKQVKEFERAMLSWSPTAAVPYLLSASLKSVAFLLRKLASFLQSVYDKVQHVMVSGRISVKGTLMTARLSDTFGVGLSHPLFQYGDKKIRMFTNRMRDLLSYVDGMTEWLGPTREVRILDLVLGAVRAFGNEISTARRTFTTAVQGFMFGEGISYGGNRLIGTSMTAKEKTAWKKWWNRTIMTEMHLGRLFNIRLVHDGTKWMWKVGNTLVGYDQFDPESPSFLANSVPLVTKEALGVFNGMHEAQGALQTILRLRRIIAENVLNVLENQMNYARELAARSSQEQERANYRNRVKSLQDLAEKIQNGDYYFPLSYDSVTAANERESWKHVEMIAATISADWFRKHEKDPTIPTDNRELAKLRDQIQLEGLIEFIRRDFPVASGSAVERIKSAKPSEKLRQAKDELALLFESGWQEPGGGVVAFGYDAYLKRRTVDFALVSSVDPRYTGLTHTPDMYVDHDVERVLDKTMEAHMNGLLGSYYQILNRDHVDPLRAVDPHGTNEIDRRVSEVMHMNLYTKPIAWDRLIMGDDFNVTIMRDEKDGKHQYTYNMKVVRVAAGARGQNRYLVSFRDRTGNPVFLWLDPHSNKVVHSNPDGTRAFALPSMEFLMNGRVVMAHTKVRDYMPIMERMLRARARGNVDLANDPIYVAKLRKWDERMRRVWHVINTIGGASKLLVNPPSAMRNSKYLAMSLPWWSGTFNIRANGKKLLEMLTNQDDPEFKNLIERAINAIPSMQDYQFFMTVASTGAELDEQQKRRTFADMMVDYLESVEMVESEIEQKRIAGFQGDVYRTQKIVQQLEAKWKDKIDFFLKYGTKHGYVRSMDLGYRLFQMAEQWNRNMAIMTTLFNTHSFMRGQLYDPLGEGKGVPFKAMPLGFQAAQLRQWALYARLQDENINYDYSRIMRPAWLRKPYMEFMAKFAVFANAAWHQRIANIAEARQLMGLGKSAEMLFTGKGGKVPKRFYRRMMNTRSFITADEIPVSAWADVARNFYGITDEEGIAEACKRMSDKLATEGIVIENARFNPLARAIRFTALTALQGAIELYVMNKILLNGEPISEFIFGVLDLFDAFFPPDDDDEIIQAILDAAREKGIDPDTLDEEALVDLIANSPQYRQLRERHFESVLSRISFSSPFGGLVVSQLMKILMSYAFGPIAGADWRQGLGESAKSIVQSAQARTFIEYLSTIVKLSDGEIEFRDFAFMMLDPITPEQYSYWSSQMYKKAKTTAKEAMTPIKEKETGDFVRTMKVNPYEKQAQANINRLKRMSRSDGPWWGLYGILVPKDAAAKFMSRGDFSSLTSTYELFERARLGEPEKIEQIMKGSENLKAQYDAWCDRMNEMEMPSTIDEEWTRAYGRFVVKAYEEQERDIPIIY